MVRSVFALSLLSLSAVNALPSNVQERQAWIIGQPDNGGLSPSPPTGGGLKYCSPDTPPKEPCFYPPITGDFKPSPKRDERIESRQSLNPPGGSNIKAVIKQLEKDLVKLQNKKSKTRDDVKQINAIKQALKHLAGITSVQAPPGTSTTFTPGKRDEITLETIGGYQSQCPHTGGIQSALKILLSKAHRSEAEVLAIVQLTHILGGCGLKISDDGATFTKITPKSSGSDPSFAGLQVAYTEGLQALGDHKPSFTSWIILEGIADTLEANGVSVDRSIVLGGSGASLVTRQQRIGYCEPIDVLLLMTLYRSILREYGRDTSKWPSSITSQARSILTVLSLCGENTSTITPVPYTPGGSITPQPTIPGGSLYPQPTIPGGSFQPQPTIPGGGIYPQPTIPGGSMNPTKRSVESSLAALQVLEKAYGTYDSGKIPAAVFLPMENLVAYLQGQGIVVLGWPKTTFGVAP